MALLIIAPKVYIKTGMTQKYQHIYLIIFFKKMVLWKTSDKSKKQQQLLNTLFETGSEFHILLMNVEAFSKGDGAAFAYKFLSCHNAMIAIDESTTIKTPTSNRTKNILA